MPIRLLRRTAHLLIRFVLCHTPLVWVVLALASTQLDCAALPDSIDDGSGLAINTNVVTTLPTAYAYVEPKLAAQQNTDLARGSSGGHIVLAQDGNAALYLMNEEDTNAHPKSQVFYRSDDGGLTWVQRGTISLVSNQYASALAVVPKSYGDGTQHRLVFVETMCSTPPIPGNSNTSCGTLTYKSDDAGTSWTQAANATNSFLTDYCSSSLAVDDVGTLHYVYSVNGIVNPNAIFHSQSTDGGQTWSGTSKIATVVTAPRWPSIVSTSAKGKHQLLVAYEFAQPTASARFSIGGIVSNDNGATWSAPKEWIAPDGNHMHAAPSVAAIDGNTVVASFVSTLGDHNQTVSNSAALAFGEIGATTSPDFGEPRLLGGQKGFPLTILSLSNTTLLVGIRIDPASGPVLQRLTLKR